VRVWFRACWPVLIHLENESLIPRVLHLSTPTSIIIASDRRTRPKHLFSNFIIPDFLVDAEQTTPRESFCSVRAEFCLLFGDRRALTADQREIFYPVENGRERRKARDTTIWLLATWPNDSIFQSRVHIRMHRSARNKFDSWASTGIGNLAVREIVAAIDY
jgi:hypothetical protein